MEALIDHYTQAEAARRFARWNKMTEEAATKAVRRHIRSMKTKSARDGELFRAKMAYSKHVKALRQVVRLAGLHNLMEKYNVDPK